MAGVLYLHYDYTPPPPPTPLARPAAPLFGGPAEVRWPSAIPAVCRVSRLISVTPRGPGESERASEREGDNHTFYMLHLPLTGVALRLGAKCDPDGESTN